MEYDNSNRGALFKNRKDNPNWPDYKGSLNVAGTDYWLSAWLKKDKSGNTYMSLSVKPKDQQAATTAKPAPKPAAAEPQDQFNDDIPF
jgi:hypothetical protein